MVWIQLPAQLGFVASIGSDHRSELLSGRFSHANGLGPWLRQTLCRFR
jgi:hypothetical protein